MIQKNYQNFRFKEIKSISPSTLRMKKDLWWPWNRIDRQSNGTTRFRDFQYFKKYQKQNGEKIYIITLLLSKAAPTNKFTTSQKLLTWRFEYSRKGQGQISSKVIDVSPSNIFNDDTDKFESEKKAQVFIQHNNLRFLKKKRKMC